MTNRKFKVIMVQNGEITQKEIGAQEFLFGNYERGSDTEEWVYAIQEIFDEVLDLWPGRSMYFQPNRDDRETHGIILRII